MFDPQGCTGQQLAARLTANEEELRHRECEVLLLAASWADLHDIDTNAPGYTPLVERGVRYGADGCPDVSECAVHELGVLRGTSSGTAEQLVADALDLRHRHPRLWARVCAGEVHAWQAKHIARACHPLTREAAGLVDLAVTGYLGQLPWARLTRVLDAAIIHADPVTAAARADQARAARGVWAHPSEDELKTLVAKAAAGDITVLMATVNRLADILAVDGDEDPVSHRRAKALALLAQPVRALQLLIDHQHDQDDRHRNPSDDAGTEPPDTDREPDDAAPDLEPDHQSLDLAAPAGLDGVAHVASLGPRVVLHFHLSDTAVTTGRGVVRPEQGEPTTLTSLRAWLAQTGCPVTVRPVLDPAGLAAVDAYETPPWLRDALLTRHPAEVFPFGAAVRRNLDCDHSTPYLATSCGGPPGQTGLHNLGPLSRTHHRAVTHGAWRRRQPEPGIYAFRSPHGYVLLVTNQGTLNLGCDDFAIDVWRRARDGRTGREPAQEDAVA